jgi:hypothetical protein
LGFETTRCRRQSGIAKLVYAARFLSFHRQSERPRLTVYEGKPFAVGQAAVSAFRGL